MTKLCSALVPSVFPALLIASLSGTTAAQVANGVQIGPVSPAPSPRPLTLGGGNSIGFDDVTAPCLFMETIALRDEYAAQGVTFDGPSGLNGGAIINECGNFGVSGYSAPNFLGFNTAAFLLGGDVPRGPETIRFASPVDHVTLLAGSLDAGTVTMECFDGGGAALGSDTIVGASPLQLLDVEAPGIVRCVISFTGSVLVIDDLTWGPSCLVLDFQTEDDLSTPLVNGQHIDAEFGLFATLTSSGPNAGLGVFDSTPGGPNDPSQDVDLLVGTGNLLILQTENYPPNGDDVFPRPNDDEDGGTITLEFATEVELASIRLVDIDAGDGAASVVLTDASGGTRTYQVPSNWTGDLALGEPGHRMLGLATLAPQPGFGSVATASESGGFESARVVRLDVSFDGSGAIDDLVLCSLGLLRASATARNGSGVNPLLLSTASRPALGGAWKATVDCSSLSGGLAILEIRTRSSAGTVTPYGEILACGDLVHRASRAASAAPSQMSVQVPSDLALVGLQLHAQGLCSGPASSGDKLRRARLSYTNAIDLVIGF